MIDIKLFFYMKTKPRIIIVFLTGTIETNY